MGGLARSHGQNGVGLTHKHFIGFFIIIVTLNEIAKTGYYSFKDDFFYKLMEIVSKESRPLVTFNFDAFDSFPFMLRFLV